jgi:Protein of unknown function (DUF3606)
MEKNMPDNLGRRQPEDPNKINVNQQWEVAYWCGKLGVTEAALKAAVQLVGPMVSDVRARLGK